MAVLTGYLPIGQGMACYASLRRHADASVAAGDTRNRNQIMADTLVERLTGQNRAADISVELQLMMPLEALTEPNEPSVATIPGYGPLPSDLARDIVATSRGRKMVAPPLYGTEGVIHWIGPIVGGDPTRRYFDGWLDHYLSRAPDPP
jgi:hypothetical protein